MYCTGNLKSYNGVQSSNVWAPDEAKLSVRDNKIIFVQFAQFFKTNSSLEGTSATFER